MDIGNSYLHFFFPTFPRLIHFYIFWLFILYSYYQLALYHALYMISLNWLDINIWYIYRWLIYHTWYEISINWLKYHVWYKFYIDLLACLVYVWLFSVCWFREWTSLPYTIYFLFLFYAFAFILRQLARCLAAKRSSWINVIRHKLLEESTSGTLFYFFKFCTKKWCRDHWS